MSGVSKPALALLVVVLAAVAGLGFGLYATKPSGTTTLTTTEVSTQLSVVTSDVIPAERMSAIQFFPLNNQTVHDAWLLFAPVQGGNFVLTIHAEGLPSTQGTNDYYIAMGQEANPPARLVPLSGNLSGSTLQVGPNEAGNLYLVLNQNPGLAFQAVQLARVDGTDSSKTTIVAVASLLPPAAG